MQSRFMGSIPSAHDLLTAAQTLAGDSVDVVAVDMPIATVPITGRRTADSEISRRFGAMGCTTHSPSIARPGPLGAFISNAFMADGYEIAVATNEPHQQALIEVYPHTALLDLLQRSYRVKYKVAKVKRYWPSLSPVERIRMLLIELRTIHDALEHLFGSLNIPLPLIPKVICARHLKRYEDALDTAICAWVGARFLQSTVIPFGDSTAAIWSPEGPVRKSPIDKA
jgi:predicted RNase H-like nuclease